MIKLTITALLITYCFAASAQQDLLVFKKGNKTLGYFKKYSYINFQLTNKQWYTAYITRVQHDSFYIRSFVVHYSWAGSDSVHSPEFPIAIADVYAMPKKGIQFGYSNDRVYINREGGHVHWAWVKNGWLFKAGAAGYVGLNVANGLIKHNVTFTGFQLGIAAGIFAVGEILHQLYKPSLQLGKKYRLESLKVPG